mmetsp:Transcript_64408/g.199631  ORF Transcript_64408/g.199631 Transcript_64408/m.199631 type:complete len:917 (+) Transcript_64408:3-2753(+)
MRCEARVLPDTYPGPGCGCPCARLGIQMMPLVPGSMQCEGPLGTQWPELARGAPKNSTGVEGPPQLATLQHAPVPPESPRHAPSSSSRLSGSKRSVASWDDRELSDAGPAAHGSWKRAASGPQGLLKRVLGNEAGKWRVRRPSMDETVAELLNGVTMLVSGSSAGSSAAPAGAEEEQANFTIFAEEGALPRRFMLIRFLSPFAVWLDRLRMAFAVWSIVYTPVLMSFGGQAGFTRHGLAVAADMAGDGLFLLGVGLAFITTFGSASGGREFLSPRAIAWRRLRSPGLWCDVLSLCPRLAGSLAGEPLASSAGTLASLQLLKLSRAHWLVCMPASHFETRFCSGLQVMRMVLWIALSVHLFACLWYLVVTGSGTLEWHLRELAEAPGATHYALAFKYGCYMVTGKPVETYSLGELVLVAISSPLGGIFFAFIYGNTTMLLSRMNIQMNKHHKHVSVIRSTLATLDIPPELKARITKYHHFLAVHHNTSAMHLLMQGLSVNLFIELRAHLFKRLFSEGPFFRGAPPSFLRALLQVMVEVTFCPGDVIIRCGDLGDQMYFIVKGRLDVLGPDNSIVGSLGESQYFGEVALLTSTPRLVTVRACTYCLLATIQRAAFLPVLESHPLQKQRMLEAMQRYLGPEAGGERGRPRRSGAEASEAGGAEAAGSLAAEALGGEAPRRESSSSSEASGSHEAEVQALAAAPAGPSASSATPSRRACRAATAPAPVPLARSRLRRPRRRSGSPEPMARCAGPAEARERGGSSGRARRSHDAMGGKLLRGGSRGSGASEESKWQIGAPIALVHAPAQGTVVHGAVGANAPAATDGAGSAAACDVLERLEERLEELLVGRLGERLEERLESRFGQLEARLAGAAGAAEALFTRRLEERVAAPLAGLARELLGRPEAGEAATHCAEARELA